MLAYNTVNNCDHASDHASQAIDLVFTLNGHHTDLVATNFLEDYNNLTSTCYIIIIAQSIEHVLSVESIIIGTQT